MGNLLTTVQKDSLGKAAATDLALQWIGWLFASLLKTEKFYDLTGSSTFVVLALQSLRRGKEVFPRQRIQTSLVCLWAVRLGLFLFIRALKSGDRRFDRVKGNPKVFFIYWTIQAVWVFLTLLPTLLLNKKSKDKPLAGRDYTGWGIWAVGFLLEVIADFQKSAFRANPANAGKFINSGLWSLSRHPNYLGEILMWSGLYVSASSVLTGWEHASVASPLFVVWLLTRLSGIPLLEAAAKRRWGSSPEFQEYVKGTAKLVPYIW